MSEKLAGSRRLPPLPDDATQELEELFTRFKSTLGFVPNSALIMQRNPIITEGFASISDAIWHPDCKVDRGFKRLLAFIASRTAGCNYSMAHTASAALHLGISEEKLAAIWDYKTSTLYTTRERLALNFAAAASAIPNQVSDDMFAQLRDHWSEEEIVELVGVIAMQGFVTRFNSTMATPLEDKPLAVAKRFLAPHGWTLGKHA